jgi:hypothetical protein
MKTLVPRHPWNTWTCTTGEQSVDERQEGPFLIFFCHSSPGSLPNPFVAVGEGERTHTKPRIEFSWHLDRLASQRFKVYNEI